MRIQSFFAILIPARVGSEVRPTRAYAHVLRNSQKDGLVRFINYGSWEEGYRRRQLDREKGQRRRSAKNLLFDFSADRRGQRGKPFCRRADTAPMTWAAR